MNEDGKILNIFAHLFEPIQRKWALKELERRKIFDTQTSSKLSEILSSPKYNYRNVGYRLACVKLLVDKAVANNRFSCLNPVSFMLPFKRIIDFLPSRFCTPDFYDTKIIDYGAGSRNTFCKAIILYINGAKEVITIDPAPLDPELIKITVLETIKSIYNNPEYFIFSGISKKNFFKRLSDIDLCELDKNKLLENQEYINLGPIQHYKNIKNKLSNKEVDIILSTSVLEHVHIEYIDKEILHHHALLSDDGVILHQIDFTDHRFSLNNYDPFMFYYDGQLSGCNGLRLNDFITLFIKNNFSYKILKQEHHNGTIYIDKIINKYKNYKIKNLTTRHATIMLEHNKK